MRIAAFIFLITGLAYLGWVIALALPGGTGVNNWLLAVFPTALLFQAYALFRSRPRARLSGIVTSIALAICFASMAGFLIFPWFPEPLSGLAEIWPMLVVLILMSGTFAAAAAFLLAIKRAAL